MPLQHCVCAENTFFLLHRLTVCNFPHYKHQSLEMKNISKTPYIFYRVYFIINNKKNLSHQLLKLKDATWAQRSAQTEHLVDLGFKWTYVTN